MKAFLSLKFQADQRNRNLIERLTDALAAQGIETVCVVRDVECWGQTIHLPDQLMRLTFEQIRACDLIIVDISEKGVGVGIEAGYACALGKPVWVIAQRGSDIPETLRGIAVHVMCYDGEADLWRACADLTGNRNWLLFPGSEVN